MIDTVADRVERAVLEMARSLEGIDPNVAYSGYAFSGTEEGRSTLALMSGQDPRKAKF